MLVVDRSRLSYHLLLRLDVLTLSSLILNLPLNNWHKQSLLYADSFAFKGANPFPLDTADEAAYYYSNIGCINQEIALVHLRVVSGVLGHFITSAGCSKVEQQMQLLGGNLDDEDLDLLVDSGRKSISELLVDERINVNNIAPSSIPTEIRRLPPSHSLRSLFH